MDGNSTNTKLSSTHKVGYDPRDMETEDEEKLHPLLTLMEEVLLLGLKDKQVSLVFPTIRGIFRLMRLYMIGLSKLLERQHLLYATRLHPDGVGVAW